MGTNIDLLIRMLKKQEYDFTDDVDTVTVYLEEREVVIKDDNSAYEINYDEVNDVAFDENEVIALLERI
ncbi:TPA: hypothetical protein OVL37_002451 [Staphylococcus aureus]|jgi:uncharacterized protein YacL (UPF0231 family)|uniref:hypothetical protein n=1 Tax=Staphylococcus epidermidis TaxID=1282 RepID=UPI00024E20D2|nr:hypothetical protein [Staphylococcus epidermidis]MBG3415868.1 hypothetical protein [Staphylococcus aureus]EHR84403.1 hypothetical protein SEVCU120_2062 [Staphylococcus epidermidis VCU120]MCG2134982.1 hypothetical protein [Staphylococcus epidermidis]MDU5112472.1 hypothetical protein [Staphylococcus epidermidis]HCV0270570.1 hypothetical protein [Staphylococcus aureus]